MQAKTYLAFFLALSFLFFGGIAAFNHTVDPYRFFDSPDRPGINQYRQKFFYGQYVSKPYALRSKAPEAVILGVSRAGSSLATDHPGWADTNVYNYAMAGSSAYLLWRNYQHARGSGELKKVLLMLDFYMFNVHMVQRPSAGHARDYEERLTVTEAFDRNRQYPLRLLKDALSSLISFEISYESWETIRAQEKVTNGELYKSTLTPSGFWINDPDPQHSQRRVFRIIEQHYATVTWFPRPEKKFALERSDGSTNLDYLRWIIADAHRQGIDLRLGFMPFHARLAETMRAVDLWDDFEYWKKQVVALAEEEAAVAGAAPYPIWDFTGYNSITMEPVPRNRDLTSRMQWHLDPSHVSRAAGDLIQNVMLDIQGDRHRDFGRRVDSRNIDQHIRKNRKRRAQYAKRSRRDLQEIQEKVDNTQAWRGAI